jgi:predicted glycosyltransferase
MKILMYSHDSYGLGHLRRTLALAEAFVEHDPTASVLILTGSTVSSTFRISPGIDLVKLPSAVKVANQTYKSSRMRIDFECLRRLRSSLISDLRQRDQTPSGVGGNRRLTNRANTPDKIARHCPSLSLRRFFNSTNSPE